VLVNALQEHEAEFIEVVQIPTLYPTGGEKQLIKVLTGREVPSHGLPIDIGMVVHNVATAAAVNDAIHDGTAGHALHSLRPVRGGLSRPAAAAAALLVRPCAQLRSGPGLSPVRLHRMRLLRLRLSQPYPAGPVLPLRQDRDEIEAALARVKAKKAARQAPKNTDNLTEAQKQAIAAVEARRQRLQQGDDGET